MCHILEVGIIRQPTIWHYHMTYLSHVFLYFIYFCILVHFVHWIALGVSDLTWPSLMKITPWGFFPFRHLPGMVVMDLQPSCHLPGLHLHLFNLSNNRMVCTESKFGLMNCTHSISTHLLRINRLFFIFYSDCAKLSEDSSVSSGSNMSSKGPWYRPCAASHWSVAESRSAHPCFQHPPLPGKLPDMLLLV